MSLYHFWISILACQLSKLVNHLDICCFAVLYNINGGSVVSPSSFSHCDFYSQSDLFIVGCPFS